MAVISARPPIYSTKPGGHTMKEPKLNPKWHCYHKVNEKFDDGGVRSAMKSCLQRIRSTANFISSVDLDAGNGMVSQEDIEEMALMLHELTIEAEALLDQWWKDRGNEKMADLTAIK